MIRVVEPARHRLQVELLLGIQGGQVVEEDLVPRRLGRLEVDRVDLEQREVALALLGRADLARHRIAGAQAETPDLRGRDVDVVGAGEVVLVRRPQEAEAVRQRLEHALGVDLALLRRLRLEDLEDQVLLAKPRGILDAERLAELRQLLHRLRLHLLDVHPIAVILFVVVDHLLFQKIVVRELRALGSCADRGHRFPPGVPARGPGRGVPGK